MRTPRRDSPKPTVSPGTEIEQIIAEILARTPDVVAGTTKELFERVLTHAARPLTSSEIHRIVCRLARRPLNLRSVEDTLHQAVISGAVVFVGMEMRPTIIGTQRATPTYRKA